MDPMFGKIGEPATTPASCTPAARPLDRTAASDCRHALPLRPRSLRIAEWFARRALSLLQLLRENNGRGSDLGGAAGSADEVLAGRVAKISTARSPDGS
jgi:hypothetical protein